MVTSLVIEVIDQADGKRSEYTFGQSPVRIGRSPLNELPLDRTFVSHCHAVIQFDKLRCEFVDLGSTNGTYLDEKRLEPNRPLLLAPGMQVTIGTLRIRAQHANARALETRGSYAFRRSDLLPNASEPPVRPSPGGSIDLSGVRGSSDSSAALRRVLPQLFVPGMEGQLVERLLEALDRFAHAFLELRSGQQRLTKDLSLPSGASDFGEGLKASDLVYTLVDPKRTTEPLDDLSRAHADLMLHQVALINAFRAGARAVLEELSPATLAPKHSGALAWLGRVFGRDARWDAYRRRVEELAEETAFSSVLLGKTFARAYAATVGKLDSPHAVPEDPTEKP